METWNIEIEGETTDWDGSIIFLKESFDLYQKVKELNIELDLDKVVKNIILSRKDAHK